MGNLPINMESMPLKAIDILFSAKQAGIEIVLHNDQLQLKLPQNNNIDDDLMHQIKENKQLIIDYLSKQV
jgi:hypothetical protein